MQLVQIRFSLNKGELFGAPRLVSQSVPDEELSDNESVNGLTVSYGLKREIELAGTRLESSSDLFGLKSYIADGV